jgi:hypothetical protein
MPDLTHFDAVILVTIGAVFVVSLWSTIFVFLYGFQKRLDRIILLLQEQKDQTSSE